MFAVSGPLHRFVSRRFRRMYLKLGYRISDPSSKLLATYFCHLSHMMLAWLLSWLQRHLGVICGTSPKNTYLTLDKYCTYCSSIVLVGDYMCRLYTPLGDHLFPRRAGKWVRKMRALSVTLIVIHQTRAYCWQQEAEVSVWCFSSLSCECVFRMCAVKYYCMLTLRNRVHT